MQSSPPPEDVAFIRAYVRANGAPAADTFGRWWRNVDWRVLAALSESPGASAVLICLVDGCIQGSSEEISEQINRVAIAAMMEMNRRAGIAQVVGYGRCAAWRPAFLRNVKVRLSPDLANMPRDRAFYSRSVEMFNRAFPGFEFPIADIMAIYDERPM